MWGLMANTVEFGEWVFDSGQRELLRGGQPVPLTPKAYLLLELLLERRPRVVSKAEIFERLWPATFVSEANLSTLIFELREALADDARQPRWVRTARGVGFAFSGPTRPSGQRGSEPSGGGWCRLVVQDKELPLREGVNVLGRSREADVRIASRSVSRRHARIVVTGRTAVLEDLQSKNGTRHGGRPVAAPTPLADGDEIRVGAVPVIFRVIGPEEATATQTGGDRDQG